MTIIANALSEEASREIILIEFRWPNGTSYYCLTDETSEGSLYTFGSIQYNCVPAKIEGSFNLNIDGKFEDVTFIFSDADGGMAQRFETDDFIGTIVLVIKTYEGETTVYKEKLKYRVSEGQFNDKSNTAEYTLSPLYKEIFNNFPINIRDKNRCGFKYDADGSNLIASNTCGFWTFYYSLSGATLNTIDYPMADASKCDFGYKTPNGCAAHFNQRNTVALGRTPSLRMRAYPGLLITPIRSIF